MAENEEEQKEDIATETDIFQQQRKTIDTLMDVLDRQGGAATQEIVYVQPQEEKEPPNYILYIGIGLAAMFLLKK